MATPKPKDQATNGETKTPEEKNVEATKGSPTPIRIDSVTKVQIVEGEVASGEKPGLGARESDDLPPVRLMRRRLTQEDLHRNAEDIIEHFGDAVPQLLEVLAKQVGARIVPNDAHGKTPTGKYVVRHGIKVQPKGEDKVRTVRPGEVVSLSDADAKFFMSKKSKPIAPELV